MVGVAAASTSASNILLTGVAGLVAEHRELTAIYVARGLEPALAEPVAEQLMHHDALGAHARDELGISEALSARGQCKPRWRPPAASPSGLCCRWP